MHDSISAIQILLRRADYLENENKCQISIAGVLFLCIDETRKPYYKGSGSDTKRNSGWGPI